MGKKIFQIRDSYKITFEDKCWNRCRNLGDATDMLSRAFREQKGKKITKKLDFTWSEHRDGSNPFYDD